MSATQDTTSPQTPIPAATPVPAPTPAPAGRTQPTLPAPSRRAVLGWAALAPVLALSAVLNTEKLSQNGYANVFYAAGVKSMLGSFHNFLFNSFDPGGLITVDKPPLALWVQVVSAKLFGFEPLSLLLPQAIIGVLTVALLYAVMRRPFGRPAALVGALALAVFPSFVAVSRENGVDPTLILLLVLACGAALRAIRTGGWPSLLASAALVGLAFNAKTLAACLVIPGIALGYLLCARGSLCGALLQLLAAGVMLGAVAFSWIAFVEATPASQRPYVGGPPTTPSSTSPSATTASAASKDRRGGPGRYSSSSAPWRLSRARTHTALRAKKTRAPTARAQPARCRMATTPTPPRSAAPPGRCDSSIRLRRPGRLDVPVRAARVGWRSRSRSGGRRAEPRGRPSRPAFAPGGRRSAATSAPPGCSCSAAGFSPSRCPSALRRASCTPTTSPRSAPAPPR